MSFISYRFSHFEFLIKYQLFVFSFLFIASKYHMVQLSVPFQYFFYGLWKSLFNFFSNQIYAIFKIIVCVLQSCVQLETYFHILKYHVLWQMNWTFILKCVPGQEVESYSKLSTTHGSRRKCFTFSQLYKKFPPSDKCFPHLLILWYALKKSMKFKNKIQIFMINFTLNLSR